MNKVILFLLLMVSLSFGQAGIFGTTAAPSDTSTILDSTAVESRLLLFNAYPEGVATLFIAGGDTTYAPTGVIGEYQLYYGKNVVGDLLYGTWTEFADSVLLYADLDNGDYDSGTMTGLETDLGAVWKLALGITFRFTQYGTNGTSILLCGYLFSYFSLYRYVSGNYFLLTPYLILRL